MESLYRHISKVANLIFRHISEQSDEEEERELENWRKSSPRQEQLYQKFISEKFISEKFRFVEENSDADAYELFLQRVEQNMHRKRILYFYRYAAVIVLLLSVGAFVFFNKTPSEVEQSFVQTAIPNGCKAILTLADGEKIHLYDTIHSIYSINEVTAIQAGVSKYRTITIPRGGEYVFDLSDGTRVWLNSESEIHFPLQFTGEFREVSMKGEVYFQVAHDTLSPFVIHTDKGNIRVLGTSFNVRDYSHESFLEATLVHGKIAFCQSEKEILLSPGEQLHLNRKSGEASVRTVDTKLFCSWKDGRLIFEKRKLSDIMATIALWYDVEVVFEDESLKDLLFTGNIKRYGELESLLSMLRLINKVEIKLKERRIIISR